MKTEKKNKVRIRIKDIAEMANVSIGTVDRVIHKRGEVREETQKRIMSIIDELGYTPNLLAKSLATKKTLHFAVIIPKASRNNPYWEKPLAGIKKGALEIHDFNAVVDTYTFDPTDEDSFKKVIKQVVNTMPAGVVFNPLFKNTSIEFIGEMNLLNIPYVYFDIDLECGNNLFFFGQNAKQGGKVAAKIMSKILPENSKILIVKLSNHQFISEHIIKREEGFREFIKESNRKQIEVDSVEIEMSSADALASNLRRELADKAIKGIFVPSSRVFKVAHCIKKEGLTDIMVLGFDLIQPNIECLNKGVIDFLIGQKPEEQGYRSVISLFNHVMFQKTIGKVNYSPIDIIIKENVAYYINY
jgi:LacI family transcriptional regulator